MVPFSLSPFPRSFFFLRAPSFSRSPVMLRATSVRTAVVTPIRNAPVGTQLASSVAHATRCRRVTRGLRPGASRGPEGFPRLPLELRAWAMPLLPVCLMPSFVVSRPSARMTSFNLPTLNTPGRPRSREARIFLASFARARIGAAAPRSPVSWTWNTMPTNRAQRTERLCDLWLHRTSREASVS